MDEGQLGIAEELHAELVECDTMIVKRQMLQEIVTLLEDDCRLIALDKLITLLK